MVELCDTHCHIHYEYPLPATTILPEAEQAGVNRIITMASNPANATAAINYARDNDNAFGVKVKACIGVYPQEVNQMTNSTCDDYRQLINDNPQMIIGIGEIGLDYYYDGQPRQRQLIALEEQLQLAADTNLPVSIHCRSGEQGDAFADLLPMLDNFNGKVCGVLHSFTDSLVNLDNVLSRGLYVGVNGIVTFNKDESLNEVYRQMSLDRIVLETDAPYLAPKPYRGKTNQPAYIRQIARQLADIRGISLDKLASITTANAISIFAGLA